MKILLYSSVFWPSIGGVETIASCLANNITNLGHDCVLVTETPSQTLDDRKYSVVRNPSKRERLKLVRNSSLVHSNGSSMAMFPYAKLCGRPFVWTHNGYQLLCVDGLGWVDGEPAPMSPIPSLRFHASRIGLLRT